MLFGLAIDNTCLIKDMSCGTEGRCLVYDRNSFRFTLHGLALGVKTAAVICYIIGFIFSRMNRYDIELNEDKMEIQEKQDPDSQEHFLKQDIRNGDWVDFLSVSLQLNETVKNKSIDISQFSYLGIFWGWQIMVVDDICFKFYLQTK